MTAQEFLKPMKMLGIAYNKEITKDQVEVWYGFFRDTPLNDFRKACARVIETDEFMPSIARMRKELALITTPQLQGDANGAWESVLVAIRKHGYYNADEGMKSLDPVTQRAVKLLGGFQRVCTSEDGDWLRKNFVQLYEELSQNTEKVMRLSEPVMTMEELEAKAMSKVAEQKLLEGAQ